MCLFAQKIIYIEFLFYEYMCYADHVLLINASIAIQLGLNFINFLVLKLKERVAHCRLNDPSMLAQNAIASLNLELSGTKCICIAGKLINIIIII